MGDEWGGSALTGATAGTAIGGPVGGLIGAGAGALLGLFGSSSTNKANKEIAKMNIAMQRETNAQNEALMRESWGRDDNAVQRRAKDLAAAGMSPLLAAGAAAGNSGVVSMTAPQSRQVVQKSGFEGAVSGIYQGMMAQQSMMDMLARQQQVLINQGSLNLQQREQDNRDKAATQLRELNAIGLKYEDAIKFAQLMKTGSEVDLNRISAARTKKETEQAEHDLAISRTWGLRKNDQPDFKLKKIEQVYNILKENLQPLNFVDEMYNKVKGGK